MKKYRIILITMVVLLSLVLPGAVLAASEGNYVFDDADMLAAETESYVNEFSVKLKNECGSALYVYTLENYEGDIKDYTYELYTSQGYETDENTDVVLYIFDEADEYWAIQGLGIQYELKDEVLGDLLDEYFHKLYVDGDTDGAVKSFADGVGEFYKKHNTGKDKTDIKPDNVPGVSSPDKHYINKPKQYSCYGCYGCVGSLFFPIIIVVIIIVSIIRSIFRPRIGFGGYRRPPMYMRGPGMHNHMHRPPRHFGGHGGFGGRPGGFSGGGSRPSGGRGAGGGGPRGAGGRR